MKKDTVIKDRDKFIGGSDVGVILGVNSYKNIKTLIKEKMTGKSDFSGNIFTRYGEYMEPKIREFLNESLNANFQEGCVMDVKNMFRANYDGYDKDRNQLIEIKTASTVEKALENSSYFAQMLFYMIVVGADTINLVVYHRTNWDFKFDPRKITWRKFEKQHLLEFLGFQSEEAFILCIRRFQCLLRILKSIEIEDNFKTIDLWSYVEHYELPVLLNAFERDRNEIKEYGYTLEDYYKKNKGAIHISEVETESTYRYEGD